MGLFCALDLIDSKFSIGVFYVTWFTQFRRLEVTIAVTNPPTKLLLIHYYSSPVVFADRNQVLCLLAEDLADTMHVYEGSQSGIKLSVDQLLANVPDQAFHLDSFI